MHLVLMTILSYLPLRCSCHSIRSRSTILCFSKFLKQTKGISTAKTSRMGVQIAKGNSVKWKVVNPPATIARITKPTAKALTSHETTSVMAA